MKHTQALNAFVFGSALGLGLGACTTDLNLVLGGKQCDPNGLCVDGYVCNELNVCVLPSQLGAGAGGQGPVAGSGGNSGTAGAAGANPADGGRGGTAGRGGSGPLGGSGGSVEPDGDAGIIGEPVPSDASCGIPVFRDADGDGIGDGMDSTIGCPEPGWVTQPGDCRDDQRNVFPGQTEFFVEPFPALGAPGDVSFDYDCSRTEDPAPSNNLDPLPDCNLLACSGSGFLPFEPPRAGDGIEPRCGSNLRRECELESALSCSVEDTPVADTLAFRCK